MDELCKVDETLDGRDFGNGDVGIFEEQFCFWDIGGEDGGEGEEVVQEVGDGGWGQELRAGGGDHNLCDRNDSG